jgi:hypothetical protein
MASPALSDLWFGGVHTAAGLGWHSLHVHNTKGHHEHQALPGYCLCCIAAARRGPWRRVGAAEGSRREDLNDFAKLNALYATYFKDKPPARATVQVQRLPKDAAVEISAIAVH